ncbi:MAG: DNA polymerase/3'-5' exonuclease PolX [Candidatus Makaraimicrobium thalassicum]|nr:MAG: DNA polymerase/3'-5' exonuclease PolX [Candidatus Omnitrophota bacterium]
MARDTGREDHNRTDIMNNREIAAVFLRIADALEINEENIFRIRAYRVAAQNIVDLSGELEDIYNEDPSRLDKIPGIGKDLKGKIIEMIETGQLKYYNDLMKGFPSGFFDMFSLSGLGARKIGKLRDELGIRNIDGLEEACKKGSLAKIEGMGERTQAKLLEAIKHFRKREGRMLLSEAYSYADEIVAYLSRSGNFKKIEKAGSLRRGMETVGDIDILAVAGDGRKAMDYFVSYPGLESVIAKGLTKSSISLKGGPQVDLRVIEASCFGAALVYFTGSKQHNVKIRRIAKNMGYKVSEYGVFSVTAGGREKMIAGRREDEVYHKLGMRWIPPELREGRGEIEAATYAKGAAKGKKDLPEGLLKIEDIKGDLHIHTVASDGRATVDDIAAAARKKGYEYFAVTDHSKYVRIAGGLDEKRLLKQVEKIRKIARKIKGIKILSGVEVDILRDGELDIADYALKELDIVIAAVHSGFSLDKKKQTSRILKAMDNRYVNVLAHPSGRLITSRSSIQADFDGIFRRAVENNIYLEINTHGERMDLNDVQCRRAKELGGRFTVNTDAHETGQLDEMIYGVVTARRGWIEKKDVLNTYTFDKLIKALKR